MRRPFSSLIIIAATIFSVLEHAHGAPVVNPVQFSSIVRRGDPQLKLDQPTQFHTVHTTQTALGPVTETCDIQLTPFKAEDGCDLVREDRKCVLEFVPNGVANSNNGNNGSNGNNGNNGESGSNGSSNTDTGGSSVVNPNISPNSGQDGATIVASGSADGSVTNSAASTTAASGSSDTTVATSTSSTQASGAAANDNSPTTTTPSPAVSLTSTNSPSPDTSSSNFQLPGTKLSVLPIGLGVFAGVSVIALIVVGLVTYERTKYRKAFRQRKLAEQGQAPGMSERPTIS